ncbi:hypothetical protein K438DRAFT_1781290 [Mycena galopus ATCC 62051]|nr:hypothetical protein K438DRAFT_1781290 [Mycena galopus ATCC 62051]
MIQIWEDSGATNICGRLSASDSLDPPARVLRIARNLKRNSKRKSLDHLANVVSWFLQRTADTRGDLKSNWQKILSLAVNTLSPWAGSSPSVNQKRITVNKSTQSRLPHQIRAAGPIITGRCFTDNPSLFSPRLRNTCWPNSRSLKRNSACCTISDRVVGHLRVYGSGLDSVRTYYDLVVAILMEHILKFV